MEAKSTTPNLVLVTFALFCGTAMTGAGASASGRGVKSITKSGTGELTVVLNVKPINSVVGWSVDIRRATPALGKCELTSFNLTAAAGPTFVFTNLNAAGSAADIASGDAISVELRLDQSGLANRIQPTLA